MVVTPCPSAVRRRMHALSHVVTLHRLNSASTNRGASSTAYDSRHSAAVVMRPIQTTYEGSRCGAKSVALPVLTVAHRAAQCSRQGTRALRSRASAHPFLAKVGPATAGCHGDISCGYPDVALSQANYHYASAHYRSGIFAYGTNLVVFVVVVLLASAPGLRRPAAVSQARQRRDETAPPTSSRQPSPLE